MSATTFMLGMFVGIFATLVAVIAFLIWATSGDW